VNKKEISFELEDKVGALLGSVSVGLQTDRLETPRKASPAKHLS
jgi:hypothetical protein